MSYYEDRIKALEDRIEEMAMLNRMKAVPVEAKLMDRIGELNAENASLKADVERLTNNCDYLDQKLDEELDKSAMLCGQVERLTKAGDNMYSWLGVCGRHNNSTGDDWLRAKKGLPSLTEQWEIEKRNRAAEDAAKEGKQP